MGLHYILQHLNKPGTYARILFVDFSSAFNTIILQNKLTQLSVPISICQRITSFLTDRQQLVRLGELTFNARTISTGAPQGFFLSPLPFSLYTNDCTSKKHCGSHSGSWEPPSLRTWSGTLTLTSSCHITLQPKTGCPLKLSRVEPGQYLDGRPPGKTRLLLEEVLVRPAGGAHSVVCVGPNALV